MGSATLQFPYLDVTTVQSAGVTPFAGGVQMYWTSEAQTRTETEPKFKMMELKAQELSGYSVSSNILLQDAAFGLEKFLFTLFGQAIAWFEDYAFLQGNGVGKPMGILNAGATITSGPNAGARTTANKIQFADIAWMWSKLLPSSWQKAIWVFSPSTIPQLLQLQDGANRAIFLSIDQCITKSPVWSLLGRPAIVTEKLPALGTSGDICLLDPSLYVVGDRMQLEVAASEHVNFLANQMTWRVVERVDGRPWLENGQGKQTFSSRFSPPQQAWNVLAYLFRRLTVFVRKMFLQLHRVVQNATDFHTVGVRHSVKQEMTWTANSLSTRAGFRAAEEKMVGTAKRGDVWPGNAAGKFWICGDLLDRIRNELRVTLHGSGAKVLVRPGQDARDIAACLRSNDDFHAVTCRSAQPLS
jgi:hypothetical protein